MAPNKSSRSKKARSRSAQVKKPQLRSSQIRDGKTRAQRREERARQRQVALAGDTTVQKRRVRPAGRMGLLALVAGGLICQAVMLVAGLLTHRWNTVAYPDSMWLYLGFGLLVSAPAVGFIAESRADVRFWSTLSGFITLGALASEVSFGPKCPPGNCTSLGARGVLGLPLSVALIVILAITAYVLGSFMLSFALDRRVRHGRTSWGITLSSMALPGLIVGLPVAGILLIGDLAIRPQPTHAQTARTEVIDACFQFDEPTYDLYVRANPVADATFWGSYLVGRRGETRRSDGLGERLPKSPLRLTTPSPYEAVVNVDTESGAATQVICRRVSPRDGNATKHDSATPDIKSENPLNPSPPGSSSPDLLQNPATGAAPAPAATPAPKPKVKATATKKPRGK